MDTLTQTPNGQNGNGVKPGIRCKEIFYERTINTGQYENEKIGITLEIEEGVKAVEALQHAREFVNKHAAKSAVNTRAPFTS